MKKAQFALIALLLVTPLYPQNADWLDNWFRIFEEGFGPGPVEAVFSTLALPLDTIEHDFELIVVDQGQGARIYLEIHPAEGVKQPPIYRIPATGEDQLAPFQRVGVVFSNDFRRPHYLPAFSGVLILRFSAPIRLEKRLR